MEYRILIDGKIAEKKTERFSKQDLHPYFENYRFSGTQNGADFYNWYFISGRKEQDVHPVGYGFGI